MSLAIAALQPIRSGASFEMGCVLTFQSLVEGRRFRALLPLLHPLTQYAAILPRLHTGSARFSFAVGKPGPLEFLTPNDHSVP